MWVGGYVGGGVGGGYVGVGGGGVGVIFGTLQQSVPASNGPQSWAVLLSNFPPLSGRAEMQRYIRFRRECSIAASSHHQYFYLF